MRRSKRQLRRDSNQQFVRAIQIRAANLFNYHKNPSVIVTVNL